MRIAHLDESGTSASEPIAVVAGIVSKPDLQWKALRQYLSDMADDLIPADLRPGVVFHAKDIWHGKGLFNRKRFSLEQRRAILLELAKIPAAFDVPVVSGVVEKANYKWGTELDNNASSYSLAFGMAAVSIEHFMRTYTAEYEVVTIIAEDVPAMRRHAKWGYNILTTAQLDASDLVPFTRIIENPMFATKDESSILQIADALAFVICRRVNGKRDVQFLFDAFADKITTFPTWSDAAPKRPHYRVMPRDGEGD